MVLYNFVVTHWIVSLIVYLVLFWSTVVRFANCVAYDNWYQKVKRFGAFGKSNDFMKRYRFYPLRYPLRIVVLLVSYVLAIPLFLIFRLVDFLSWKREKESEKRSQEAAKAEQEHRERVRQQNEVRALGRRDWFGQNKPQLYFNTVNGITAVLRPADYETIKKETEKARTNEFWTHNVFRPHWNTFAFVTKLGAEVIESNDPHARLYKVAGWLADLHELCQRTECSLIRDETIFVPYVNETLLSFEEQGRIIQDCHGRGSIAELIDKQAPMELQPVA